MKNNINIGLEKLEFIRDDKFDEGLFLISEIEKYKDNPYIYIALQKAKKYKNIYAVYFRTFIDNRPPIPQIYLFDLTNSTFKSQDFGNDIQKRIWNSTQVPLIYVFTKTEILIYNTYSPEIKNNTDFDIYKKIRLAAKADNKIKNENENLIKDFSTESFANGSFWDKEQYRKDFVVNGSVYEKLISKLNQLRKELINNPETFKVKVEKKQRIDIIHKLMVMTILIKYLEEKTDEFNSTVFPTGFFSKYHEESTNFVEVLRFNGNILELFDDLSNHFNGEIFKIETEKVEGQQFSELELLSKV